MRSKAVKVILFAVIDSLTTKSPMSFFLGLSLTPNAISKTLLQLSLNDLMQFSLVSKGAKSLADRALIKLSVQLDEEMLDTKKTKRPIERVFILSTVKKIATKEPAADVAIMGKLNQQIHQMPLMELPAFLSKNGLSNHIRHPFADPFGEYITNKDTYLYRALCHFVGEKRIEVVKYLLSCRADPNHEQTKPFEREAMTLPPPLLLATDIGDLDCVKLLLENGAKGFSFES